VKQTKEVNRPAVISSYFLSSNVVDRHNQLCQGILQFETLWCTRNPWFRLITSIVFGMTVTDAYLLGKHSAPKTHQIKRMTIKDFAAAVAHNLAHMKCFKDFHSTSGLYIPQSDQDGFIFNGANSSRSQGTSFSFDLECEKKSSGRIECSEVLAYVSVPEGAPKVNYSILVCHPRGTHKLGKGKRSRPLRKKYANPDCSVKTQYFCIQCQESYCSGDLSQQCFFGHICRIHLKDHPSKKFEKEYAKWNKQQIQVIKNTKEKSNEELVEDDDEDL
jgi:hypothetical protein